MPVTVTIKPKDALVDASHILVNAKEQVLDMLSDNLYGHLKIGIRADLDRLINRLNFLTGRQQETAVDARSHFPPITHFMGEKIEKPKVVKIEDMTPKDAEKKIFLDKVDALEKMFPTLPNQKILDAYSQTNDTNVIRGVAKRAGIENYRRGEINEKFLEDIRTGMAAQIEKKENIVKVEASIK